MPAEDGMQCRWMKGILGYLYLEVVLCVMDGRNGNEMAMLAVYDVEGQSSRCLGTENRIGILGKALGGPARPRLPGFKPHIQFGQPSPLRFVEAASNGQTVPGD